MVKCEEGLIADVGCSLVTIAAEYTSRERRHLPLLGPCEGGVIEGSLQRPKFRHEADVDLLVVDDIRVVGLRHHTLKKDWYKL